MGVVAAFDYTVWSARYPEFSNVTSAQALAFWNEGTLYHANDGTGPVQDVTQQQTLLNMLAAHIAMISVGTAAQPASGLVGRVSSANQGSVSVSVENAGVPGTAAWFVTTVYGFSYWQATTTYRTMHYRPGFGRRFGAGGRWW